ncbi:MAG: helix-turn-helix domain-containing protein [Ruminococcaceae bacterium]|nr:helix-turn-helix domain-containing protein [Oscillospiraceae bacterium]
MDQKDIYLDFGKYRAEYDPGIASPRFILSDGYLQDFPHWHRYYELHFIIEGNYTIECCDKVIRGSKPRITLYCPYTMHHVFVPQKTSYRRFIVTFNKQLGSMISPALLDLSVLRNVNMLCAVPDAAELHELTKLAQECWLYRRDPTFKAFYSAMMLKRTLSICERGRGELITASFTYIQDALKYMVEHLSEAPTALEMAARFGVCKAKFHKDFKATVGKSYREHLTELRMSLARRLLTGGASIVETALEAGYSGEAAFIKAYRGHWGITPGEYKKGLTH